MHYYLNFYTEIGVPEEIQNLFTVQEVGIVFSYKKEDKKKDKKEESDRGIKK